MFKTKMLPAKVPRTHTSGKQQSWDLYPGLPKSLGFLGGLDGKESAFNAGDLGSSPSSGRSPGEGNG